MKLLNSKKNNSKGFSLIEMVVAFALLAVVVAAVGGFIITGVRSYAKNNNESSVQNEAQMALNQIEGTVIDASLGVSYNVRTSADAAGDHFVLNDSGLVKKTPSAYDGAISALAISDLAADAVKTKITDKLLYVFNWGADVVDPTTHLKSKTVNVLLIRWNPADKKLYYAEPGFNVPEKTTVSGTEVVNTVSDAVNIAAVSQWDLFAEGVESFSCDLSDYDATGKITVKLSLDKNGQTYATNGTITLRNDISVNASNMSEIYARVDNEVETVITGVKLYTSADTIVKDGNVKLTTEVTGSGYPSQSIDRWTVYSVSTSGNITFSGETPQYTQGAGDDVLVFDSADSSQTWPVDISNSTPRQLTLNSITDQNGKTMTLLKITCYLSATDEDGNPYSYTRYVAVKELSNFSIKPSADMTLTENQSLTKLNNEFLAASYADGHVSDRKMDLYPGNKIQMTATVDGNNLTERDKKVVWSMLPIASENIKASISADGVLQIDKYSQVGTVFVQAYPELNPSMALIYEVHIGNATAQGQNALEITTGRSSNEVNRGESIQLGLKLNGNVIDRSELSDFNWTVAVQSSLGTINNAASVSAGYLTIGTGLSFDYKNTAVVTASLKNNPDVTASVTISIPKVTLTMSPQTYAVKPGQVVPEGTIKCIVTGIVDYDLDWTIATSTNPTQFGGTAGNGSFVTKSTTDPSTAKISISSKEPSKLSYIRLKATLQGYSNYYAQAYLPTSDVTFSVSPTSATLNRNATEDVTRTLTASVSQSSDFFNVNQTNWTIVSAKTARGADVTTTGLSITKQGATATFTLSPNFAISSENIVVTVKAELNGKEATVQLTIKPTDLSAFTITSNKDSVNRGGSATITANGVPSGYSVIWEATSSYGNPECTGTNSAATLKIPVDFHTSNTNDRNVTVKATLYLGDQATTASKTLTITVPKVSVTLSRSGSGSSYTYTASASNIENENDYVFVWKLVNSATSSSDTSINGYSLTGDYTNNTSKDQDVSVTPGTTADAYIYVGLQIKNSNTVLAKATELVPRKTMLTKNQLDKVQRYYWDSSEAYVAYSDLNDNWYNNYDWLYRYDVDRYSNDGIDYYIVVKYNRNVKYYGNGGIKSYSYAKNKTYYLANSGSTWYVWNNNWSAYQDSDMADKIGVSETAWSTVKAKDICEGFEKCITNSKSYKKDDPNSAWVSRY